MIIIGVFLQIKAHYVLWNIAVVFILFVVVENGYVLGKMGFGFKKGFSLIKQPIILYT